MISTQRIVYCTNPSCTHPVNSVEESVCVSCQTPLTHRYIWAVGSGTKISPKKKISDRYEVIAPQIWLDTKPGILPEIPEKLPAEILPYLQLYQQRLHIPQVYGFAPSPDKGADDIVLLENVPINSSGKLYSKLTEAWEQVTAARQIYWLWQILQLWEPLSALGVASSLLVLDNLRVQGWCVRLLELSGPINSNVSLQELGVSWKPLLENAKPAVFAKLQPIIEQMCSGFPQEAIAKQLNLLLLSSAAELPLMLKVAGVTDTGSQLPRNEDSCFPNGKEIDTSLLPRVSIVCDGIGGHEGGEVASKLAVQSIKLQIYALLAEITQQTEPIPPDLLQQQLAASLRIVNNLICATNDEQKREAKKRMATTLVMALQLPQRVQTTSGWVCDNAHELYLVSVGDSRAYWITRNYCQLLTVDDDVVTREVIAGRSLYRQAISKVDYRALTQALGTKEGEFLRPQVQRFILEEDGILLLCSDGLSDNNWVEHSWKDYAVPIFTGELSLEDAVNAWIKLANEKNGHDNTSVVITHCRISPEYMLPVSHSLPRVETPGITAEEFIVPPDLQSLLTLDTEEEIPIPQTPIKKPTQPKPLVLVGGILALVVVIASLGLSAWWLLNPHFFQQMCQRLPQKVQQICLPRE